MPLNSTFDSPVKDKRASLEMAKDMNNSEKINLDLNTSDKGPNCHLTVSEELCSKEENMEAQSDLDFSGKSDPTENTNKPAENGDVQSKQSVDDIPTKSCSPVLTKPTENVENTSIESSSTVLTKSSENVEDVQSKPDVEDEAMETSDPVDTKLTENITESDNTVDNLSSDKKENNVALEKDSVESQIPEPKETTEIVKNANNGSPDSKEIKSSNKSKEIEMNSENDLDSPSRMPGRGKKRGRSSAGASNDSPQTKKRTITSENKTKVKHHTHPDFSVPGVVLTLGEGDVGQLGLGEDIIERSRPGHVKLEDKIVQVVAGGMHTVCLTQDGKVITFGCNDESALGRDTTEEGSETLPVKLSLPYKVIQCSAGDSHTAVLTDDGHVYAWGNFRDANGSMGLTSGGIRLEPLEMLPEETVVKIVSGGDHLVCLTVKGEIFTGGCAEQGQLGRVAECFAGRGGRKGVDSILKMGAVRCKKHGSRKRALFSDIWAGQYVTFAKELDTGDLYSWGLNNYFQLGFSDMKNRFVPERVQSFADLKKKWVKVQAGQHHTVLSDEDGQVYTLGRAEYGRLGLGENPGERSEPALVKAIADKKCIDIAAGQSVSFALTEDGAVYSWGMGTSKQLGTGDEDDQWLPFKMAGKQLENRVVVSLSAGGQHTVLLSKDKS